MPETPRDHVRRRASERYGLELSEADIAAMERLISERRPEARFVGPSWGDGEKWTVDFRGERLRVVYRRKTGEVVTLKPGYGLGGGAFRLSQFLGPSGNGK